MTKPLNFQQIIMTLQNYWAGHGCLVWQPYHEAVGAGTGNPATALRALGPEPWNVAYVEPSFRPDDGRYGDNPNRMQMHHQFQVILKPDPGNPQELYLDSLFALGIRRAEHDIRFVEDNWESPALGAWGLGWEVWLDGMEISQYTYFQQMGGLIMDPVAVELTYGLERIAMYLQGVKTIWDIDWDGAHTYRELLLKQEIEYCVYDFELGDVPRLTEMYDLFESEAKLCLAKGLVLPAHDYVLRCSHTFNLLDARGAIGVTERARYFARMRDLSRAIAQAYYQQREESGFPFVNKQAASQPQTAAAPLPVIERPADLLFEIGVEELPASHLEAALESLRQNAPALLAEYRLAHNGVEIFGTPRRLILRVSRLASAQRALEELVKGPPAKIAFDAQGQPTKAAMGFARSQGVELTDLRRETIGGGEYAAAVKRTPGRPAAEVLGELLPRLIAGIGFERSMRWNQSGVAFSRPIRWLLCLLDEQVVPVSYAGLNSGRSSVGPRGAGSPGLSIASASAYFEEMKRQQIIVDPAERMAEIKSQIDALAKEAGGLTPDIPELLAEVTNLVETPTALLGSFDERFLNLPEPVLVTVMKKHQRYFPVLRRDNNTAGQRLLPCFIAVRNGGEEQLDVVRRGNENVLRARFADAEFFFETDQKQPLEAFLPRLDTLAFQEQLGSMLGKTQRLEKLAPFVAGKLGLPADEFPALERAAHLAKADLATQMVVELTSLQGEMGRQYARLNGEEPAVCEALYEYYLPRYAGDALPQTKIGLALGIADRLDSLAGLFAVGCAPTSSADPYGMRRDALGLVLMLIESRTGFSLIEGLQEATRLLPVEAPADNAAVTLEFIRRRLEGLLKERGWRYDVVQAVLTAQADNPYRCWLAAQALLEWVNKPQWESLLTAYARCVRIVRPLAEAFVIRPADYTEPVEKELLAAYLKSRSQISAGSDLHAVMAALEPLVEPINRFFEGVLVMDENQARRENRLALLQGIRDLTAGQADLSKLMGF